MVPNGFRLDQCLDGLNCRVREDPQLVEELVIGTKVDIGVGLVPQRPPFSISKRAKPDRTASFSHPVQFFLREPAVRGWNGKGISVCKISSEHFGAPKSITRVKGSGVCVDLSGLASRQGLSSVSACVWTSQRLYVIGCSGCDLGASREMWTPTVQSASTSPLLSLVAGS